MNSGGIAPSLQLLTSDAEYEEQLKEQGAYDDDEDGEEFGVFNPAIDIILWRRLIKNSLPQEYEYLVKLKEYSYLHCEWIKATELSELGKASRNKLNRFNKTFDQRIYERVLLVNQEIEAERDDIDYFDPSYVKVDRILKTAEIFPVIHSKKANEIKGKWSELTSRVLSKLLNYSKDNVPYGTFFMEPVNPDIENCPDYKKIITHPMDLGTLSNRIYLDYYKNFNDIWKDLGYVFKNCRLYNSNESSDIRVLCDTLREYAKLLYRQWHRLQSERYHQMKEESISKQNQYVAEHPEDRASIQTEVQQEVEAFINTLFNTFDKGMELVERSDFERLDRETLKTIKGQYVKDISFNTGYFMEDAYFISQITKELDRVFSLTLGFGAEGAKVELVRIKQSIKEKVAESINGLSERRFEQFLINKLHLPSKDEIETFNPGDLNFNWLKENDEKDIGSEELIYFEDHEAEKVDLMSEIDRLYLVKWSNLSYMDITWETESVIDSPSHVNEFR